MELRSNTSFVSQSEDFRALAQNLVEQVLTTGSEKINSEELLKAPYILNAADTVAETLKTNIAKFGENIEIGGCAYTETKTGLIETYIHNGGRVGVLLNLESDKPESITSEAFKSLAHDLAMHIAAMNPMYISQEDIPTAMLDDKKAAILKELAEANKPAELLDKIATGKLNDWKKEICLLDQIYIKDPGLTIEGLLKKELSQNGTIKVNKFYRLQA